MVHPEAPQKLAPDVSLIALHESGHAVVSGQLHRPTLAINLARSGEGDAGCWIPTGPLGTTSLCREWICILCAGVAAERVGRDPQAELRDSDKRRAESTARMIHGLKASEETIQSEIDDGMDLALRMVSKHWPKVERLARAMDHTRNTARSVGVLGSLGPDNEHTANQGGEVSR